MNVRDSEVICGLLKKEGFVFTDDSAEADIVLFNTCSVRKHAEDKVWSEIGRIVKLPPFYSASVGRRIKTGGAPRPTKKIIGLVGCMAQNYKEEIFKKAANVDFVVGPSDIHKIPSIIKGLSTNALFERKIWETDGEMRPDEIYHTGFYEDKTHAYVVISEGCSNFCSYCVVPYVRGALRNRPGQKIIKEIEEGIEKGISSITLLGQNVNAYKDKEVNFVKLLETINALKGLKEFSFITSHPKDTSLELFKTMNQLNKLRKYLHLPVQSGSDRILELMGRGYTRKFYLDLTADYRKIVKPGILTTDIIVGFPGESEKDFADTEALVRKIEFDAAYIFKYSTRPHTKAEELPDDVERQEKERRHRIILDLQRKISLKKK